MNNDNIWKDELLKKVHELELAQQVAEVNTKKITAENDALNKEVEQLRHLEQLRQFDLFFHKDVKGNKQLLGTVISVVRQDISLESVLSRVFKLMPEFITIVITVPTYDKLVKL